jgi:hypothetical protein
MTTHDFIRVVAQLRLKETTLRVMMDSPINESELEPLLLSIAAHERTIDQFLRDYALTCTQQRLQAAKIPSTPCEARNSNNP